MPYKYFTIKAKSFFIHEWKAGILCVESILLLSLSVNSSCPKYKLFYTIFDMLSTLDLLTRMRALSPPALVFVFSILYISHLSYPVTVALPIRDIFAINFPLKK